MADENKEPRLSRYQRIRSFKTLQTAIVCSSLSLAQNIVLDLFLVQYHETEHIYWVFVDVSVFVMLSSSEYYAMSVQLRQEQGEDIKMRNIFWMTWLWISSILCVKMAFIFMLFSHKLDESKVFFFGPNTLRTIILLSSVVFILFLNCQFRAKLFSYQHTLVTEMGRRVVADFMDNGDLCEIFFNPLDRNLIPIHMHYIILAIVFYNMLLPSMTLYVLNKDNYGLIHQSLWRVYLYRMWLVLIVNCPNLAIRIFLYTEYNAVISLMALKNVLMIIISVHEFHELRNEEFLQESISLFSTETNTSVPVLIDPMVGKVYDAFVRNIGGVRELLNFEHMYDREYTDDGRASAPPQVSRITTKEDVHDDRMIVSETDIDEYKK